MNRQFIMLALQHKGDFTAPSWWGGDSFTVYNHLVVNMCWKFILRMFNFEINEIHTLLKSDDNYVSSSGERGETFSITWVFRWSIHLLAKLMDTIKTKLLQLGFSKFFIWCLVVKCQLHQLLAFSSRLGDIIGKTLFAL